MDVTAWFKKGYGQDAKKLSAKLRKFKTRLLTLDPTWPSRQPSASQLLSTAPLPGWLDGYAPEFWVMANQLGFDETSNVRGKTRTNRVREALSDMMAEAEDSPGKPLQILMPAGISVGAAVPDFGSRKASPPASNFHFARR